MNLKPSVAELQIAMELECIDRMYLNAYVPQLTTEAGVAGFVCVAIWAIVSLRPSRSQR
jgi:hypothetical protein